MAQAGTKTSAKGTEVSIEDRLSRAWEYARNLSTDRKIALLAYTEFLLTCDFDEDLWEPDAEEREAIRAWLAGEGEPGIPLEEVMRESEELGENVLG